MHKFLPPIAGALFTLGGVPVVVVYPSIGFIMWGIGVGLLAAWVFYEYIDKRRPPASAQELGYVAIKESAAAFELRRAQIMEDLKQEHEKKFKITPPVSWLYMESIRLAKGAPSWVVAGLQETSTRQHLSAALAIATRDMSANHSHADHTGLFQLFDRGDDPLIDAPCTLCGKPRFSKAFIKLTEDKGNDTSTPQ